MTPEELRELFENCRSGIDDGPFELLAEPMRAPASPAAITAAGEQLGIEFPPI